MRFECEVLLYMHTPRRSESPKQNKFILCSTGEKTYLESASSGKGVVTVNCFEDLRDLYNEMEMERGEDAYRYVSDLLLEAKELHHEYLAIHEPDKDKGQSWRSFKGKSFEQLVQYMIMERIEALELMVVNGNKLERSTRNLSQELKRVKRNLTIDYGEFGCHLPDVDVVVYDPKSSRVVAIISSKVTLRERIAQTGYWKFKLSEDEDTAHVKVYFVTLDEDGTLIRVNRPKKGRAIVGIDLDGTYVLTKEDFEESDKIKLFEHFIEDLKHVIGENQ